jgi:hypothetical protein
MCSVGFATGLGLYASVCCTLESVRKRSDLSNNLVAGAAVGMDTDAECCNAHMLYIDMSLVCFNAAIDDASMAPSPCRGAVLCAVIVSKPLGSGLHEKSSPGRLEACGCSGLEDGGFG